MPRENKGLLQHLVHPDYKKTGSPVCSTRVAKRLGSLEFCEDTESVFRRTVALLLQSFA